MRLSFPARRYVLYPIEIFVIANVWLWISYGVFYVLVWKNKNYQNLLIFHAYEVKWKGMDVFYISYADIQIVAPWIISFVVLELQCGENIFHLTPCILWCRLLNMLVHNNFMYVQFDNNNVLTRNCVCVCVCLWSAIPAFKNILWSTVKKYYNCTSLHFCGSYWKVEFTSIIRFI